MLFTYAGSFFSFLAVLAERGSAVAFNSFFVDSFMVMGVCIGVPNLGLMWVGWMGLLAYVTFPKKYLGGMLFILSIHFSDAKKAM